MIFKKIIHFFFGTGPIWVKPFVTFLQKDFLIIDQAESLTGILKKEQGAEIYYEHAIIDPEAIGHAHRQVEGKPRYQDRGFFVEPDRILYALAAGCIFGNMGIIYDLKKRTAVKESATDWFKPLNEHQLFAAIKVQKPVYKKGIALSLCTTGADGGYYHFLLEVLPKLVFCAPFLAHIDYFLIAGDECDWKKKWLQKAHVPLQKVIWQTSTAHYQFDQLLFTSRLIEDQQISYWQISGLRNLLEPKAPISIGHADKKIYISRKNVAERILTWEADFIAANPELVVYDAADLDAEETIAIFKQATLVIAVHGAGLSNLVFCEPHTEVLEIYPEFKTYQPCYQRICNLLTLNHKAIWVNFEHKESKIGLQFLNESVRKINS